VFQILWQFDVPAERASAFTETYGPAGPWTGLFRQSDGFRGTELFRGTAGPPRFLTLDRWVTRDSYEAFRREHAAEYRALDAACEDLTTAEVFLSAWES
jgi:heme-degrading monooxygenase HmoA